MNEPISGPPGPSPLLILAAICLLLAAFCGLTGFSGNGHHTFMLKGLCWLFGSIAMVAAYWDHEHRRFK